MSNDLPPPTGSTLDAGSQRPLLERLGLSGQLIGGGSIVGLIALFLPLVSWSTNFSGAVLPGGAGVNISQSVSSIDAWQGKLSFLAYAAAVVLVLAVYPTKRPEQKPLGWGALGAGALALLLALWLLFAVRNVGSGINIGDAGGFKSSIGFGGFLNLIAAGVVTYGGYLKAREEGVL